MMTALPKLPTIAIEPIPGNPGYIATIVNGDPECDPMGSGATPLAAALDLARQSEAVLPDAVAEAAARWAKVHIAILDVLNQAGRDGRAMLAEMEASHEAVAAAVRAQTATASGS